MGLIYMFPVAIDEVDRIEIKSGTPAKLILKTYGLPMIFWGYLCACLIVIASMWLASKSAIEKLVNYQDQSLLYLGLLVKYTLLLTPLILLAFFFYEKQIHKSKTELFIVFKIFFIPFWRKSFLLDKTDGFTVDHYLDSPNMAKIHNKADLKQFENKGYFELYAVVKDRKYLIDRHSRKADLIKLKELLSQY